MLTTPDKPSFLPLASSEVSEKTQTYEMYVYWIFSIILFEVDFNYWLNEDVYNLNIYIWANHFRLHF